MLDAAAGYGPLMETSLDHAESVFPCAVRNLMLDLDGDRLIDGIDLDLTPGKITMVMGPNGAGKSLLLRLLHGLIPPSSGEITWGGRALDETVRQRQAMVFQRPVLLRRSVSANIDFVLGLRGTATPGRRAEILDLVGLTDRAKQPARLLSGGEQQRLALARALALSPDVLFLDEPTASLDPASVHWIEEIVRAAQDRGTKIIFVTHDIGQAKRLGDEIVFLHRGCVLEHTPAGRFFEAPASDEAREYLNGQIIF